MHFLGLSSGQRSNGQKKSTRIERYDIHWYSSSTNISFSSIIKLWHMQLHPLLLIWISPDRGSAQTSALRVRGNAPNANNVRMASRNECNVNWAPMGFWSHGQGGCFIPSFQGNWCLRVMREPLIFGLFCDLPVRPGRFSSIPIGSHVCACATYLHCARMWCDHCRFAALAQPKALSVPHVHPSLSKRCFRKIRKTKHSVTTGSETGHVVSTTATHDYADL